MNEIKLFNDAQRWPGKASISDGTGAYLAEHLADVRSKIDEARNHYADGEYGTCYAKLEKVKSMLDAVEDSSGWDSQVYDYHEKTYTESYPALEQLLTIAEEASELENAEF